MRGMVAFPALAAAIALGLWSGTTTAEQVGDSEMLSAIVSPDDSIVELVLPAFVVSVSTAGDSIEHVRARFRVKAAGSLTRSESFEDKLTDAVLYATTSTFNQNPDAREDQAAAVMGIASIADNLLGGGSIEELHVETLALFRYSRR